MGKKSKKSVEPKLSKKELKKREAELEAEIERREKKAAKKALKKSDKAIGYDGTKKSAKKISKKIEKKLAPAPVDEPMTITAEAEAPIAVEPEPETKPRHPHLVHLDRVAELNAIVNDESAKPKKREKAAAELARLRAEGEARIAEKDAKLAETDAEVKARVQAKRAAREEGKVPDVKAARMPDALEGETEADYQMRKLREKRDATVVEKVGDAVDALRQAVEEVETEHGREFAVGSSVAAEEFAKPSDAKPELEEGRNGYKIIQLKDGKPDPRTVRQMTRVTTFVGNIDDETTLKAWDKRMVAEGLAKDATAPDSAGIIPKINEIVHRRDVAIAKATKNDRKGKLGIGEVGHLIADAEKEAKDAINALVEEAAALAGRNDKANGGTHLHTLAEICDEKGIDEIRRLHESGELVAHDNDGINEGLEPMPVTATDLATIEAYAEKMSALGARVIHSEFVIVNDSMGYAGRGDRVVMAKLPELTLPDGTVRPADQRARRYIVDLKSGRVDLGGGKISRQLAAYALGDLYDLETGERTRHSAARDVALVFHLPQGMGTCAVLVVDLKVGTALLKLSAEVRRGRNTGRKAIGSTDILEASAS